MNIESLRTMVQLDLEIDESNLHTESIKTPQLHNKYLVFYQNSKLELEKLELEEKILKKDKWLYYTGKIGQDDLESYGWEPFDYNGALNLQLNGLNLLRVFNGYYGKTKRCSKFNYRM